MPKKRSSKKLDLDKIEKIASYEPPKSYQSLFYGALTVIAIFIIVFFGIRLAQQRNVPSIGENGIQTEDITGDVYIVKPGDSLWSIAEAQYKDGYKWIEIARLNNLSNTDEIEKGMRLKLPNIAVQAPQTTEVAVHVSTSPAQETQATAVPTKIKATPTSIPSPTKVVVSPTKPTTTPTVLKTSVSVGPKITANTYTVVRGDNLWNIAVRAYGDGFKWVNIAKANKLANPHLIHSGNKFVIPR